MDKLYCWKCGVSIATGDNNYFGMFGFDLDYHSKTCPACSKEAEDIIRKYDYEFYPATGWCYYHVYDRMDYSDQRRLTSFGFGVNGDYDSETRTFRKYTLTPPSNIHVVCTGDHEYSESNSRQWGGCKRCGAMNSDNFSSPWTVAESGDMNIITVDGSGKLSDILGDNPQGAMDIIWGPCLPVTGVCVEDCTDCGNKTTCHIPEQHPIKVSYQNKQSQYPMVSG